MSTEGGSGVRPGRRLWPTGKRSGASPPPQRGWTRAGWLFLVLVVSLFALNYWAAHRVTQPAARVRVPYSPFFLDQVRANNVAEIRSKGTAIQGTFVRAVKFPPGAQHGRTWTRFSILIPSFADTNKLSTLLERHRVVVNAEPPDAGLPWWENLLYGFGPTFLLLLLLLVFVRRAGRGSGVLGSFGRSRARRYQPTAERVTFADVAGIDEAKSELAEIVDFLRNPDRYHRLGGRIPRGVLLSGPPGTGKTLLARAVAGEAEVPFFSMSASEFIEAIVGVGASRVRDLFAQAKRDAPAIIFIDELDAIGRSRSGNVSGFGAGDEREQTLNQILTEMDGFDPSTGVIVVAATNRMDVLDQALLRPGRFDRRVTVLPPDRGGRRAILDVHTRGVPLAADVDLDQVARSTPGMVGADLANLVNEAALLAASRGREEVAPEDFGNALEKIILGAERKVMLTEEDRRRTAYHEAGHAIVGMLTPGADPVRKVSIIPRGMALGVTFSAPDADRYNFAQHELMARIGVALGGRVAEELVLGEVTTGAESDIIVLTELARHMVGRWGMSEAIGPIAVLPVDGRGPFMSGAGDVSARTQELVNDEVRRIVDKAHGDATKLLTEHRDKLDALAHALLEKETLDEDEAYAVAGVTRPHEHAPEGVIIPI